MKPVLDDSLNLIQRLAAKLVPDAYHTVQLRDGAVLHHTGEPIAAVSLISSGYIKLTQIDTSGASTITAILGPGQVLNSGYFPRQRHRETAQAKTPTTLLKFALADFERALQEDDQLLRMVMNATAQRQALTDRHLHALLTRNVRSRVALILYDLMRHSGQHCAHGHEIDMPLTQQELGEMVGASRPAISLTLNQLRDEGVLEYCRRFICINDLGALQRLTGMTGNVSSS